MEAVMRSVKCWAETHKVHRLACHDDSGDGADALLMD